MHCCRKHERTRNPSEQVRNYERSKIKRKILSISGNCPPISDPVLRKKAGQTYRPESVSGKSWFFDGCLMNTFRIKACLLAVSFVFCWCFRKYFPESTLENWCMARMFHQVWNVYRSMCTSIASEECSSNWLQFLFPTVVLCDCWAYCIQDAETW